MTGGTAGHWRAVYERLGAAGVSWHQDVPVVSLEVIGALGLPADAPVVDVGGGASLLVDRLLERGHSDVTVLDLARPALAAARERLGPAAGRAQWLEQDVLTWSPVRRYALWHDRAVFHFLVGAGERARYAAVLHAALAPGGRVVMATFAPDGPETCSGLPVRRYDPDALAAELGGMRLVDARRELHRTPGGRVQPFSWVVLEA